MKKLLLALTLLASACHVSVPPQHPTNPSPTTFIEAVTIRNPDGSGATDATATFVPDDGSGLVQGVYDPQATRFIFTFNTGVQLGWGGTLTVASPNTRLWQGRGGTNLNHELCPCTPNGGESALEVHLQQLLPAPPTRDQAIHLCTTFQGLTVNTPTYGTLPLFEAALPWMSYADRQAVYAAKHAAGNAFCPGGDTHLVIQIPSGPALYDEPNQPYSADRFPPLDWTNGLTSISTQLNDLVVEVRQNGFIPVLFMQEDQAISSVEAPLVIQALHNDPRGDLSLQAVFMPGWDGVFYGWSPDQIVAWGSAARSLIPQGFIGIEHQPGRFPVGEGGGDWVAGGRMTVFDFILGEYNEPPDDTIWQIAARSLGPAYVRPPDQPSGDDPNPPWYFATPSPRGPYTACFFEFNEYSWIRGGVSLANIIKQRAYGQGVGYNCGG